ncbi:MAG: esterase [Rhodobacterales bacterium]|nr:MAG: esterase [Rhodobacterales bacterium]
MTPSRRARVVNWFVRNVEKRRLAWAKSPASLRLGFAIQTAILFHGPWGSRYRSATLGGVEALEVSGFAQTVPDRAQTLLYFHGGGYVMGSPRSHRAMLAHLSRLTGGVAWLPDYRKAPEHPFPGAIEDAVAAYRALCSRMPAQQIVIGGDSAGGGVALALLGEISARGLPQPAGCFAFSPLTDLTFSGASMRENAGAEAMLPAARVGELRTLYLDGADPRDPRASPLFAEFSGEVPVWLAVGDSEILLDDTRRMARYLESQGGDVVLTVGHDLPHAWPMFQGYMPEARATLEALAGWIKSLSPPSGES